MNLEMSELKSESESIGSPVSFFSRDSNMSISSSPENYLDGDSVGTSGSLGGRDATGDEANIKPDQRSVSADGSSPHRTGESRVTDDNLSTTESANKGYSFDNESQWDEI